jgi:hypothetical protein
MNFDQVVLRAMNRQPQDRYPSVSALAKDLLPFASDRARAIWSSEFEVDRTSMPAPSADSPNYENAAVPLATTMGSAASELASASEKPRGRRGTWIAIGLASMVAVAVAAVGVSRSGSHAQSAPMRATTHAASVPPPATHVDPPAPTTYHLALSVNPATAVIVLDGQPAGTGHVERDFARDGTSHDMRVSAEGFEGQQLTFRDAPPPDHLDLVANSRPPTPVAPTPPVPVPPPGEHGGHVHSGHAHGEEPHSGTHGSAQANPGGNSGGTTPPTSANGAPILN